MIDGPESHWQAVQRTRRPTEVSWYQPIPRLSLDLIRLAALPPDAAILDVGGGSATLVDHLVAYGFTDVSVLDIAPAALEAAGARLGAGAARVQWIAADITAWCPTRRYDLWHDRAVLHFLVDAAARSAYLHTLKEALSPAGHVILAVFGPAGPPRWSGGEVRRYSVEDLCLLLGDRFRLVRGETEEHVTPGGTTQQFVYGLWRAVA